MVKKKYYYIFIIPILVIAACIFTYTVSKNSAVVIKPLDKDFNSQSKFGVQYYLITGSSSCSPKELASYIQNYRKANLSMFSKAEMILFYKDSFFSNYKSNMWDSARENEFGGIEGFNDNLVAKIWIEKTGKNNKEHFVIYRDDKIALNKVSVVIN